ncbi:hypothetical protein [Rhodohalobacter sp. SW132]|nr:hypothetical protein [Rhodohalobacter sp. SW132]
MTRYKFTGLILLLVFLTAGCDLSGAAEDLEENEEENPVSVFPPELLRLNIFFNKKNGLSVNRLLYGVM